MKLKRLFAKVHREKPESSRAVCDLELLVFNADSCRNPEKRTLWHCVAKRHRPKRTSSANDDLDGAWLFQRYYVYPYLRSESVTYQSSSATWVYNRHCVKCGEGWLQVYHTHSLVYRMRDVPGFARDHKTGAGLSLSKCKIKSATKKPEYVIQVMQRLLGQGQRGSG